MNWLNNPADLSPAPEEVLLAWLTKPQRLSLALKKISSNVGIHVLSEQFEAPFLDEQAVFIPKEEKQTQNYIRKVLLRCDDKPVIFARTVVPHRTYEQYQSQFQHLSNQFIGETLLYHNQEVTRQAFEFAHVALTDTMREELTQLLPSTSREYTLWARRSLFRLNSFPLLITEIFLPDIQKLGYPDI